MTRNADIERGDGRHEYGMNLFEAVKANVTTHQAAENYGLAVNHSGMCKCPFHNDKNPSMKVDSRFHCFGCQADGDVIDFTGRLFNLSPREAAIRLSDDFGIQYDTHQCWHSIPETKQRPMPTETKVFKHKASYVYRELTNYRNHLLQWRDQYAPKTADEDWHPLFIQAVNNLDDVEWQLDILLSGMEQERREIVTDYIRKLNNMRRNDTMEPTVNVPVYYESPAHARKYGELEQYRKSHFTNIDCKKDIEETISKSFDGFRLNKMAAQEIIDKYGTERVSLVLAATVQVKAWDGRFSPTNKDWAFTFDFPEALTDLRTDRRDNYAVTTHPAVLDGFINQVRQEIKVRELQPENERKFAVLLTDAQEIKIVECDPQEEMFSIARSLIGCEWIELVEPVSLSDQHCLMLIDEEGKLRDRDAFINCVASDLYGSDQHGDPIVGSAVIVRAADEKLELLTADEAKQLAVDLVQNREKSIEKISRSFGIQPERKTDHEMAAATRRQSCRKNDVER